MARKITIKSSERGILLAKTGAGKTEWAKWLLRQVQKKMPVFIVDIKHFWLGENPIWATGKEFGTVDKPRLVTKFNPKWHVQVLQPSGPADVEASYAAILRQGGVFVYVDETRGLASATQVPPMMARVWTQGRALGVAAWVGSQSARGIPLIFKSQAEKWVILEISKPDLESIEEYVPLVGSDEMSTSQAARHMRAALGDFRSYYYSPEMDEPELMEPVPMKGAKKHG